MDLFSHLPFHLGMGFLKKIAGLLGFVKDGLHESKDEADDQAQALAQAFLSLFRLPSIDLAIRYIPSLLCVHPVMVEFRSFISPFFPIILLC